LNPSECLFILEYAGPCHQVMVSHHVANGGGDLRIWREVAYIEQDSHWKMFLQLGLGRKLKSPCNNISVCYKM